MPVSKKKEIKITHKPMIKRLPLLTFSICSSLAFTHNCKMSVWFSTNDLHNLNGMAVRKTNTF